VIDSGVNRDFKPLFYIKMKKKTTNFPKTQAVDERKWLCYNYKDNLRSKKKLQAYMKGLYKETIYE